MKDYAIVSLAGKQYKVSVGDKITTDFVSGKVGEEMDISSVLLLRRGGEVEVGKPNLGMSVTAKIIEDRLGDKINVFKYKAKSRYRKTKGFRAKHTILEVSSLGEKQVIREKQVKSESKKTVRKAK